MKMIFKLVIIVIKKENYHTKQKEIILDIIKKENGRFSINDIYKKTRGVGLTTVYRFINKLVEEDKVSREVDNNNQVYYYYLSDCKCRYHMYLKCSKCGKMIHINCDFTEELYNHILKEHGFVTNKEHLIINGMCQECR